MMRSLPTLTLLSLAALAGCSTAPITFDESLALDRAARNDVPDWDTEMRYRVGFQYANAARNSLSNPTLEIPPDTNLDFQVPFAIWDYTQGNTLGSKISFLDWFNAGLSDNSRYSYYYNRGLGFMVNPNTHYFAFDERPGNATAEDVRDSWSQAKALFDAVHNRNGNCYVHGFSEKDQYRRTFSKDVPGLYKEVAFWCDHPLFEDKKHRVSVSAWANPFDGLRVLATVQSQCYIKPPRGERFVDVRDCGIKLANRQRDLIPEGRFPWTELIITPLEDGPSSFEVRARRYDQTRTLPAPALKQKYIDFLASRDYTPE